MSTTELVTQEQLSLCRKMVVLDFPLSMYTTLIPNDIELDHFIQLVLMALANYHRYGSIQDTDLERHLEFAITHRWDVDLSTITLRLDQDIHDAKEIYINMILNRVKLAANRMWPYYSDTLIEHIFNNPYALVYGTYYRHGGLYILYAE